MLPEPSNLRSPPTKRGRTESAPTESEPGPSGEQSTGAGAPGIPNENSSRANGNAGAQPSESVLARVQTQPTRVTGRVQRQNWSTDELARVCQEYRELKESTGGVEAGGPAVWFGKLSERYNRVIESVNRAYGLNLPARNWSSIRSKLQRDKAADRIFDKVWDRVVVNPDGETVILDDPENSSEQIEDHRIGEAASAAEPTTTASSPDTEWVIDDEFRENFNHFVATWMGKTRKVRKPIKFPRKVPEVLWKHANHLVAEHVANGTIRSLADLNRTVYAASCTVAHVLKLEDKKCAQREKDWFAAREAEIKNLSRYLNWIDVELTRRRQSQRLTPRQKRHVVELRLRYGRDRVADTTRLIELKSMLRDVLAMTRRSVMRRRADRDRKRGKFVPLRKYLESGESRDDPALRVDEIREYWAGIVGESQRSQSDAITAEWAQDCNVSAQEVTDEQLRVWWRMAVSKCKPNKAPGPDGIPGVSWKRLPCASDWLCTWLINALRSVRVNTPGWLAHGRVVLLYKKGDASDPANYRPIACLNTCYKLITSVIEKAIREQVSACPQLLPREQIANRKGVWGCTHASIVDRMVTGSARVDKGIPGGLRVLFYDCQKAFDSVLRDHMFKVLEVAKIDRKLLLLMKSLTMNWTVRYELRRSGHTERSNPLRVRRGLLQGDTLSPTWFCLCIAPISKALRDANPGPQFRPIPGRRDGVSVYVGHMFYMDDLKVYCAGERAQVAAERLVPELFSRIGMNINASKSAAASLSGENTTSSLPVLGVKDQYKYLGIESGFVAHEVAAYARMEKVILAKVSSILQVTQHTVGQRRHAIRTVAFPGAAFILANIILGDKRPATAASDMDRMDMEIRKLIRSRGILHAKCANPRMYLSCERGGLGWPSLRATYYHSVAYSAAYLLTCQDPWVCRAKDYFLSGRLKGKNQVYKHLLYIFKELGIGEDILSNPGENSRALAQKIALAIDTKLEEKYLRELAQMPRAGRWVDADSSVFDPKYSYLWLEKAWVNDKAYQHVNSVIEGTLLEGVNPHNVLEKCRACGEQNATIAHITNGCRILRETTMKQRHDGVARWLYSALTEVDSTLPRYHYTQPIEGLVRGERLEVRYDIDIPTPNMPRHCRPDVVIFDRLRQEILIAEVSVTWHSSVQLVYENKYNRYAVNSNHEYSESTPYPPGVNLANELRAMYPNFVRGVKVLPLVITPTGHLHREFVPHIQHILQQTKVSRHIERMQRAVVLGTDYIIRTYFAMPKR
ncbi:unnamed protein product [Bursaphelenchus xylophilus]|uniref:(pine wood nematode) hypothetical protein n=1 Tax=Bursaphelenchus xylophilus TaxID=6326 RepID=A0A7I8XKS2_BURXY|nr:unnamed protein product [Bursaphelenchus xylophilus]CAD5229739.1 unnamed protein product [Bursaphelenchus xylophilus]CAD5229743.1 unnamed protein product [Bursaphelenchus xylophilus]CAG9120468.1 unnamed protein product [Bursaphelenchus xylophilus]CAG9120472.1 unnamed protein product [Bursaphelenchus xylophilus]